ncbi:olfactory receptor Olr1548 [Rattus norvegicus]|uniref:Olfactory receptor n=1 Tax=Rattus norvegicus TaxID=10116 RepID=A0ABK0L8A4_RAT|nr:olfactory receptor Olr1548 [Rattus norvegicus]|eukprot:NP_001001108.1 olfactory receptor Olr1548 [Rattus norvegicus]
MKNSTVWTEFVLTGLTESPELQRPLFLLFLVIYLITIAGNLGLIALIWSDSHLHIPMYFFLGHLAFVDACLSSTVTPKMLLNFLQMSKMISFSDCMTQFFFFAVFVTTECFLLAAMAYDRYVAICKPLLYPMIMTNRLCICLLVLCFVGGFLHSSIHEGFLFLLTFCNSNIVHHFYCDIIPLLKISCTDSTLNFQLLFVFAGIVQVFTIVVVLFSYTLVLFTILQRKSLQGIRKAFSTCGAHLLSVSLYYGPLLFIYVFPMSQEADDQDIIVSLLYAVIIPVLNPIIYSLRNKQVMDSLRKIFKKRV